MYSPVFVRYLWSVCLYVHRATIRAEEAYK